MKNYSLYSLSIALLVALGVGISSCKEDDPPVKPKISFSGTTMTVSEADGVIEVGLGLDKPYGKDLRVDYTLSGTASDQDAVGTANADYQVVGDHGVVVIESGQTSAVIQLEIFNDATFEEDENIEISIIDVNTTDVEITSDNETEVIITSDDAQLMAQFAATTLTTNEDSSSAVLKIKVLVDKPAPADIAIGYTLTGTALDSVKGFNGKAHPSFYDYYINGVAGQVVVKKDSTFANIEIQLLTDFNFENDETIIITLNGSNAAQIGTNKTMTITVNQQNGKIIALVWDDAHTDVDMDMFLWFGEDTTALDFLMALAVTINEPGDPKQEVLFVPSVVTGGSFGLSYVYYSGTANPMNFESHFIDFTDGVAEDEVDREIYAASYTLDNINAWDQSDIEPIVVHRFVITDGVYGVGKIQVPASNSRIRRPAIPRDVRKTPFAGRRLF